MKPPFNFPPMRKTADSFPFIIPAILFCILLSGCTGHRPAENDPYENLPHFGKDLSTSSRHLITDSLFFDASMTSLQGRWYTVGDSLWFIDRHIVPVRRFDIAGNYTGKHLMKGHGPNELIAPLYWFCNDTASGYWGMNNAWQIMRFDKRHHVTRKHHFLEERKADKTVWAKLLRKPDPTNPLMYEPQYGCSDMGLLGGKLIIPITTEHPVFNGYEETTGQTEKFYTVSYLFAALDTTTFELDTIFGSYSPIFRSHTIPNFAGINFDTDPTGHTLVVSFQGDPWLYVYDTTFRLHHSFGIPHPQITGEYPETHTAEEADARRTDQYTAKGYYAKIKHTGNHILRQFRTDNGNWGIEIYDAGSYNLLGRIPVPSWDTWPIGQIGEWYYTQGRADTENERYIIYKFRFQ